MFSTSCQLSCCLWVTFVLHGHAFKDNKANNNKDNSFTMRNLSQLTEINIYCKIPHPTTPVVLYFGPPSQSWLVFAAYCQTPILAKSKRLGVDFVFPLSQSQSQESEPHTKEQLPDKTGS
jgi:hypothetical protein